MLKRFLSRLAIGMVVVACGVVLSEKAVPASQDVTTPTLPDVRDTSVVRTPVPTDVSVDRQMQAFEHHARVNMILYTGRFGQSELATTGNQLNAIALSLKTNRR